MLSTNAEVIGTGILWRGALDPNARMDIPTPIPAGTPLGQHLRVRRLARLMPGRALYVVDNIGPKWAGRKCWSCGNKYSPGGARSCSFCGTPLTDRRFLMTARWDRSLYEGVQLWTAARKWRLGIISPVALIYRDDVLHTVYQYNGESLLLDEPSPLHGDAILSMAVKLAEGLVFLHDNGVLLRDFGPQNVVVMPDGSVRWFDLDVLRKYANIRELSRQPSAPIARDAAALGAMLFPYCDPADTQVATFVHQALSGAFQSPVELIHAAEALLRSGRQIAFAPRAHAISDVGLSRLVNEDDWGWYRVDGQTSLFVIADGMGGHAAGEVASRVATRTVTEQLFKALASGAASAAAVEPPLKAAMLAANDAVWEHSHHVHKTMGTTLLVAVVLGGRTLVLGHAGDCRAYLFRGGVLKQLTRDHTLVQDLVDDGQLTMDEARVHPRRNVVTTTVGGEKGKLAADVLAVEVKPGDRILLCSDGLWGAVPDAELAEILGQESEQRPVTQALLRAAFDGGSTDNVTLMVVEP